MQKEYSDDGLSGHAVSSLKTIRHRDILFVFMSCSVFFRLKPGLSISSALMKMWQQSYVKVAVWEELREARAEPFASFNIMKA